MPFVAALSPLTRPSGDPDSWKLGGPDSWAPLTAALQDLADEMTDEERAERRAAELAEQIHEALAAIAFLLALVTVTLLRWEARSDRRPPPPPEIPAGPEHLPLTGGIDALAPPAPTTTSPVDGRTLLLT